MSEQWAPHCDNHENTLHYRSVPLLLCKGTAQSHYLVHAAPDTMEDHILQVALSTGGRAGRYDYHRLSKCIPHHR